MSLAVLADHMASKGRGPDSMLIHMSPREVQGLQALAMKHGGSLTINPDTGLPEAGFLDKLLPTIIGAGISFFSGGAINPLQAAAIVGGVQTVRTGDIGKGIQAGLGAYGGAGMTAGLTTAGESAIGSQAAGQSYLASSVPSVLEGAGAGLSADMAYNLGQAGIDTAGAEASRLAQQAAAERIAAASPFDKLSAGAKAVSDNPMSFANKDNLKYLAAAAGPAIMAGANVQAKGPQTVTKPGMIRPYSYDPYSGGFTAASPYEAAPTRAAEGGLMGMAQGGYTPGMFDFAQHSEPVVRMAGGGAPPVVMSDEDLFKQTGSWEAAAKLRDEQNNALNQYNWAQQAAAAAPTPAYFVQNPDVAKAFTENSYGMSPEDFAKTHYEKFGQAEGRSLPSAGADYAATHGVDIGANVNKWIQDNPFATAADIKNALTSAGLTQEDVNPYLTANTNISDATRYALSHATEMPGAGGLAGMQANILKGFATPDLTQAQIDAEQRKYGVSNADIQSPLIHGYQIADTDLAKAANYLQSNPDVQAWLSSAEGRDYLKQHPEFDASDIAYTHYKRYGEKEGRTWEEAAKKPPIVCGPGYRLNAAGTACEPIPVTPPPPPFSEVTPTGFYGNNTGNPLTSTPGDITSNPDGTVTVQPNIPGRPDGGFPGMASVRDAYTAGGGSLGYIPYAPKTIEEFESKYNKLTGGSKQSYDYLMGKTPYSPTPYTPTGEVMKPYAESVLGMPVNKSKRMYIFDPATKTYKINPDYAIPTYDKDGNKTYNLTNKDVITYMATKPAPADFYNWAKTNNLTVEQIAAATGMPITEVQKMLTGGAPADTATKGESSTQISDGLATGGLAAMARGGQYDLGDYSDGGRLLRGPGDGVSDSIPASIGNKRPARLADGEFVVPARIVSELGNGSTEAGARKLYAMMDRIQAARRGTVGKGRVAKNSRADKHLPA